jgi:hypothetical protein
MHRIFFFAALCCQAALAQVNLGGVSVPKDKFVVFLFIGHSNMAGRDINHSDNITHPRAWNYRWMSDKQWVLAKEEPGNLKNGLSGRGCGGGGMPNLKALAQAYPAFHIGAIDNASLSGTAHGSVDNNSSGMPGDSNRYWKGSQLYNEITAAAKEVRKTATLGGIFCMLGAIEATRTSEEVCRNFSNDIRQMVTDMRAEIGEPNLPFLLGRYEAGATGTYAPSKPWPKIISEQIDSVPAKLAFSALVESQGVEMLDDHHYTATALGHGEWAKRALAAIQAKGWFPGSVSILARGPEPTPGRLRLVAGAAGPTLILYPITRGGGGEFFVNALGRIPGIRPDPN